MTVIPSGDKEIDEGKTNTQQIIEFALELMKRPVTAGWKCSSNSRRDWWEGDTNLGRSWKNSWPRKIL